MRSPLSIVLGLVALAWASAGCVSLKRTPEARFFVLQALVESSGDTTDQPPVALIGVERVRLPGHLDRAQLVTWQAPDELRVDEFLRWAEPLDEGLTRTVTEDLAALLPDHQVIRRPWRGDVRVRCRVVLSVSTFGLQRDGLVRLVGRWALLPDSGGLALRQQAVKLERGPVGAAGEQGVVAAAGVEAMSGLVSDVSRQIAEAIRALPVAAEETTDQPPAGAR